ncbi:MAG: hypothetical protein ACYCZO_04145 [Daejeonella sp.]
MALIEQMESHAFCFAGELIQGEKNYNEPLLVAGLMSVLLYLFLKILKYNTTLLQEKPNSEPIQE